MSATSNTNTKTKTHTQRQIQRQRQEKTSMPVQPGTDPSIGRSIVIILFLIFLSLNKLKRASYLCKNDYMQPGGMVQLYRQTQPNKISYSLWHIMLNTFIILLYHIQSSLPSAIHNLFYVVCKSIRIFWCSILGSITNMFGDTMSFATKSRKF